MGDSRTGNGDEVLPVHHCKSARFLYACAVKWTMRHLLVWMLAISLIASGFPIAHAASCADHDSIDASMNAHHGHVVADMDAAFASDAVHSHDAHGLSDSAPAPDAATFCKCLNCSNICAAFVAPLQAAMTIVRRVGAMAYLTPKTFEDDVSLHVDPGIPIAA